MLNNVNRYCWQGQPLIDNACSHLVHQPPLQVYLQHSHILFSILVSTLCLVYQHSYMNNSNGCRSYLNSLDQLQHPCSHIICCRICFCLLLKDIPNIVFFHSSLVIIHPPLQNLQNVYYSLLHSLHSPYSPQQMIKAKH